MYDPGPPPGGPPRLGRERSDADTTRASFLLRPPGDTESSVEARLRQAITKKSATSQQTQRPDGHPCDVVIHWGPAGNADDERRDDAADDAEQQRDGAPHDAEPQARADDSQDGDDSQATLHLMSPVPTTRDDDDAGPNGESDAATGDA